MRTPGNRKDFAVQLPERPNLRHLRDQAKKLVRAGGPTLAEAQLQIARQYGFPSWPKLKQHVEDVATTEELKKAIKADDLARVDAMLKAKPASREVLSEELPTPGPKRAAMFELLLRHGADINWLCWGWFPLLFFPCENLEPAQLRWLLAHGADPNRGVPHSPGTALDYVIQTYVRDPKRLTECIEALLAAGAQTRYTGPGFLPLLRQRNEELSALLRENPALVHRRYPELDCGASGGRLLLLHGGTLLHVAAEYGFVDAARLLLDHGADVNVRAEVGADGVGGQTPVFHALTSFSHVGNPEVSELLIKRGADLSIRARVPGHYERKGEILDVTAAEYAALFPLR